MHACMQTDALRSFYTSLKEQVPGSEMATRWCVQHGLLPRAQAEAWVLEQAQVRACVRACAGV